MKKRLSVIATLFVFALNILLPVVVSAEEATLTSTAATSTVTGTTYDVGVTSGTVDEEGVESDVPVTTQTATVSDIVSDEIDLSDSKNVVQFGEKIKQNLKSQREPAVIKIKGELSKGEAEGTYNISKDIKVVKLPKFKLEAAANKFVRKLINLSKDERNDLKKFIVDSFSYLPIMQSDNFKKIAEDLSKIAEVKESKKLSPEELKKLISEKFSNLITDYANIKIDEKTNKHYITKKFTVTPLDAKIKDKLDSEIGKEIHIVGIKFPKNDNVLAAYVVDKLEFKVRVMGFLENIEDEFYIISKNGYRFSVIVDEGSLVDLNGLLEEFVVAKALASYDSETNKLVLKVTNIEKIENQKPDRTTFEDTRQPIDPIEDNSFMNIGDGGSFNKEDGFNFENKAQPFMPPFEEDLFNNNTGNKGMKKEENFGDTNPPMPQSDNNLFNNNTVNEGIKKGGNFGDRKPPMPPVDNKSVNNNTVNEGIKKEGNFGGMKPPMPPVDNNLLNNNTVNEGIKRGNIGDGNPPMPPVDNNLLNNVRKNMPQ